LLKDKNGFLSYTRFIFQQVILLHPFCNPFCNPYFSEYNVIMEKVAEKQKKNKFLCEFLRFPDTNTGFAGAPTFPDG
jgi:hypothetical protein